MTTTTALQTLKNPSEKDVFILDIDSTLVSTHQRNQSILETWIKQHSHIFPEECRQLTQSKCQFGDYGLTSLLSRVNYIEVNSGARQHLDEFWRTHFFSNNFLHSDVATRGAVNWTQELEEKGVDFLYLTARHKPTMWDGTLSSLDEMGFPISAETLYLKEDLQDSDEAYKAKTLKGLLPKFEGKTLWLIDNEPVVLHKVKEEVPDVQLIWFESTHSGRMQAPEGILRINQFCFD